MGDTEGALRRTSMTAAVVAAVLGLWLWAYFGGDTAGAFLAGVLVGLFMLGALVLVVERTVRPPEARPKTRWPYAAVYIGKFVVAAAALYGVSKWWVDKLPYFALGYGIPILVLILKIVGSELMRRSGPGHGDSDPETPPEGR